MLDCGKVVFLRRMSLQRWRGGEAEREELEQEGKHINKTWIYRERCRKHFVQAKAAKKLAGAIVCDTTNHSGHQLTKWQGSHL